MEEVSRRDGYDDAVTGGREGGEGSVAGDDVELSTSSNVDDANGNAATDYRRLINEQRHELEELKRAAREASPSSSSRHPMEHARALQPPPVPPPLEPQQQQQQQHPLPPVPSLNNYGATAGKFDGAVGSDTGDVGRGGAIHEYSPGLLTGESGEFNGSTPGGGVGHQGVGAGQQRYAGVGVGGDFLAAVARRRKPSASDGIVVGDGIGGGGGNGGDRGYLSSGDNFETGLKNGADWDNGVARSRNPRVSTEAGRGVVKTSGTMAQDTSGVDQKLAGDRLSSSWQQDGVTPARDQRRDKSCFSLTRREGVVTDAASISGNRAAGLSPERPTNHQRETGNLTVRFARRREGEGTTAEFVGSAIDNRPSAIADEALASLGKGRGHGSVSAMLPGAAVADHRMELGDDPATAGVNVKLTATAGDMRVDRARSGTYNPASTTMAIATATTMADGIRPLGGGGGVGVASDVNTGKTDATAPPLVEAAPTTTAAPPHAAYASSPTGFHGKSVAIGGFNSGHDDGDISFSANRSVVQGPATAASLVEHGSAGERIPGSRSLVGSSWGVGGGWGGKGNNFPYDRGIAAEGRGGGTLDSFRSESWAEKLVTRREEQSVLVRQLERELASTVSALKDERSEKRAQAEALKSRLDKTRGTVRDREAELERRERMTTTLMTELEALRSRCDRLSESREERAAEADKTMTRLREDNRELEARLRQADAAAAEARAARAGADAERVRMERDLHSALAKVTSVEQKAEEEAEAATVAADEAARELRDSKEEVERLRSEMETLRKHAEEEQLGGAIGSLRAQVADLERLLETSNHRCAALEARLALLEKELVEAEGGEVEARARLRWALGQLGNTPTDASAAAAAAAAAAANADNQGRAAGDEISGGGDDTENGRGRSTGSADATYSEVLTQTALRASTPADLMTRSSSRSLPLPSPSGSHGVQGLRGAVTSPLVQDSADMNGSGPAVAAGRYGHDDAVTVSSVVDAVVAEEDNGKETEFREPNWRSMVPVLFPPGWRDRKATAANAATMGAGEGSARGMGAFETGAAAVEREVEIGSTVEASSERSAGIFRARRALRGATNDQPSLVTGQDGDTGEKVVLDQGTDGAGRQDDGGVGGDAGVGEAMRLRARPQRWERGAVFPGEGADDEIYSISEERVQAALDHLTAEERSFAYMGGVETEYGQWPPGVNSDQHQYDGFDMRQATGASNGNGVDPDRQQMLGHGYLSGDDGGVTPEHERRGMVVANGMLRGNPRRRRPGTAAEGGTRAGASDAPKGKNSAHGVNIVVRRSRPTTEVPGASSATSRQSGGTARISLRNLASSGRSERRLNVSVPVPRGSDSTPGPRTRAGRPPSHPRTAAEATGTSRASVSATRQRRLASRSPSMTPNGMKPNSSGGRGSVGGVSRAVLGTSRGAGKEVPLQRPQRRSQRTHPPTPGEQEQQQPAEHFSAGAQRRRTVAAGASVVRGRGTGGGGNFIATDDGVSMDDGATTKKPTRRRAGRPSETFSGSTTAPRLNSVAARGPSPRPEITSVGSSGRAARRGPKSATAAPPGPSRAAKKKLAPGFGPAGAGLGGGGTREYVSLMRRRRERGAAGSSLSSSRLTAGGGGDGDRRLARGGGGLSGSLANSSICSGSRAWR